MLSHKRSPTSLVRTHAKSHYSEETHSSWICTHRQTHTCMHAHTHIHTQTRSRLEIIPVIAAFCLCFYISPQSNHSVIHSGSFTLGHFTVFIQHSSFLIPDTSSLLICLNEFIAIQPSRSSDMGWNIEDSFHLSLRFMAIWYSGMFENTGFLCGASHQ